jgi:hypothetical protein
MRATFGDVKNSSRHLPTFRSRARPVILATVLLLVVAFVAGCGSSKTTRATRAPAQGVSAQQLASLSGSVGHAIYWAGPRAGKSYELSRTKDGRVFVRYLPPGAKLGDPKPNYLAVGTYPQQNAFAVLKATAKKQSVSLIELRGGGMAFVDKNHPTSVYLAYPGSAFQIEVYDPSAAVARRLVASGKIIPVGIAAAGRAGAKSVSATQLQSLADDAGHEIYWAGPEAGMTYEFTQTSDGRTYVRYLPRRVKAGDPRPRFLTVGTYPQSNAFATLKATAAKSAGKTVKLSGGALAWIGAKVPTSVYIARPGDDVLVEFFDPSASRARQLATSGQITTVR